MSEEQQSADHPVEASGEDEPKGGECSESAKPRPRRKDSLLNRKARHSNRERYITAVVDVFSFSGTLQRRKKKRARSLDRRANSEHHDDLPLSVSPVVDSAVSSSKGHDKGPDPKGFLTRQESYSGTVPMERNGVRPSTVERGESQLAAELENSLSLEERLEKTRKKADIRLKELLTTEENFVEKNLKEIIDGYYDYMERSKREAADSGMLKMPEDLKGGKDRIVFGNIRDIQELHVKHIYPNIEACMENPSLLHQLFESRKISLKIKYGRYCLNKQKSEFIIKQNEKYFTSIYWKEHYKQHLSTQLMTPIQRITRYHLLLREILKEYEHLKKLSPEDYEAACEQVSKAYDITVEIAHYVNDMMIAGRINHFDGDVTAQGLLLKRSVGVCFRRKHTLKKAKTRTCQFFVFQETIIICEIPPQELDSPAPHNLDYFASFKMNRMIVREYCRNDSQYGFELEYKDERTTVLRRESSVTSPAPGPCPSPKDESTIVILLESEQKRDEVLKVINNQIRELKSMALRLVNPVGSLDC